MERRAAGAVNLLLKRPSSMRLLEGVIQLELIPLALGSGLLLTLGELVGLCLGIYALERGGRGQRGGLAPIPERGIHAIGGSNDACGRNDSPYPRHYAPMVLFLCLRSPEQVLKA